MSFGWITHTDGELLKQGLNIAAERFPSIPLRVVEVGFREGNTSRGLRDHVIAIGRQIDFWGFDSGKEVSVVPPFEGARVISGESTESFLQAPSSIHFLFIDGCHCVNHALLDFLHFSENVLVGGVVAFHDTHTRGQGVPHGYQGHGPNHPLFSVGVREAIRKARIYPEGNGWKLVAEGEEGDWGGVVLFERLP